jgi:Toprim-like
MTAEERKEQSAKETLILKQTIDIVAFLDYIGLQARTDKSSSTWLAYDFPTALDGEFRMLIPRSKGIHDYFISPDGCIPNSDRKGGGVDFIAKIFTGDYKKGMDLLRQYANMPIAQVNTLRYSHESTSSTKLEQKVCQDIMLEYNQYKPVLGGVCKYLNERGINNSLLNHQNFHERIFQQTHGWNNVAFPTFNEVDCMITIQERNHKFQKLAPYDIGSSLWSSKPPVANTERMIKCLVIGESPEDVLSYLQLHTKANDSFYALSTFGQMSAKQLNRLTKIILETKTEIVSLVHDNDIAGYKYRINLVSNIINEFEPTVKFDVDNNYLYIRADGSRADAFNTNIFENSLKNIDHEDIVFSNETQYIVPNGKKNVFQAKLPLSSEVITKKLINNMQRLINKQFPYINIVSEYSIKNDFNEDLKCSVLPISDVSEKSSSKVMVKI